ncbi:MAG TPA: 2,3-dihydroxybiphenyl 1,2-dioxygenase [Chloroflexota bacterium]
MANLVAIVGVTHNPFLPGLLRQPPAPDPTLTRIAEDYAAMRTWMAQAEPDTLVVIGSDHLNQWFMDNMPAFSIGKASVASGPFPHEQHGFRLAGYEARVDADLAKALLYEGSCQGVDFAFSDEFLVDHAFTVPLGFVRPEMDLPIVPIWTNVMAPPVPSATRFYAVGQALRRAIQALPADRRIGVLASGHLSIEIGGPRPYTGATDAAFDRRMMELISAGAASTVVEEASWERMLRAGNVTAGFLNYVLLMGLAGGRPPDRSGVHFPAATAAVPFMAWGEA